MRANVSLGLLLLLLLASCGPDKHHVRIKGDYKNLNTAEFFVFADAGGSSVDTIRVDGGSFSYDYPLESECVLTLLYPNYSRTYLLAEPGATVRIRANAEHLLEADVTGTDANDRFTKFRHSLIGKHEGDVHLAAQQYIRDNAKHIDGVAAFIAYFANADKAQAREAQEMLRLLKESRPKDAALAGLEKYYRPILSTGEGQPLPAFSARLLDGSTKTAEELRGTRPMLILFFASWQNRSVEYLRILRRLRRAYPAERLAVLAVSLDVNRKPCEEMLRRDSITVPVAFDGLAFDSPLTSTLGVRYVPGNLLVNAQGRITARDLKPEGLEAELAKLF